MSIRITAALFSITALLAGSAFAAEHVIEPAGTKPSVTGSSKIFTGTVRTDSVSRPDADSHYSATYVTFEPGARTFWHTHPAGQRLIVLQGRGRVGTDTEVREIRPGDVVWCPAGVRHWHGASPETAMTHLALTNVKDGKNVEWLEAVSDADYAKAPGTY
ncbi:cupin domain-containing protein [Sutterella sp.]|uniref:(R)-mandelonitrile lyase n=1 Tax=Sutterella sp. TaxID=1981025 RepID=UPI0026E06B3C|nr:cupin domain-containing protein [Sutterella sp.]MDO5531502.1 cupin domain-containing protein [Sutterella sp.]